MLRRDFLRMSGVMLAASGCPRIVLGSDQFKTDPRLGHKIGDLHYSFKNGLADFDREILNKFLPKSHGGVTYFVDPERGEDGADGISWRSALKTVGQALKKLDVSRVVVKGGCTYRIDAEGNQGIGVYSGSRDVAIVSHGGVALFTTARSVTWDRSWFKRNGNVCSSSATGGSIVSVVDTSNRDRYGEYVTLKKASSFEECKTIQDSWYYESGRAYVNRDDIPGDEILLLRSSAQGVSAKNVKVYFSGIHFLGGSNGAFSDVGAEGSSLFFEDCKFSHNWQSDGLKINDSSLSVAVNCIAAQNAKDGFNYHKGLHTSPHFVEVSCQSYANHAPATGNGSSSHDQCVGIRINSSYHSNAGPGVADVNDARTFNISCASHGNGPSNNSSGFLVSSDGKTSSGAMMWLDHCSAGNNSGHDVYAGSGGSLIYRSLVIDDGEVFSDGSSKIRSFG